MAQRQMDGEREGHTLQATALVHEVYLRLIDIKRVSWQDRSHFFVMAARLMRRVLVDHARAKRSQKRGAGAPMIALDDLPIVGAEPNLDILALDAALDALGQQDPRKSQVVEMRYFAGLTIEETAAALDVSLDTVMRDWRRRGRGCIARSSRVCKCWRLNDGAPSKTCITRRSPAASSNARSFSPRRAGAMTRCDGRSRRCWPTTPLATSSPHR